MHHFDRGYSFDHAGRLTQALTGDEARGGTNPDGPYKETFQYDSFDHMTSRVNRIWSKPLDSFETTYVNNRNQLPGYTYDADGNPTSEGSFDAAGRKVSLGTWRFYHPIGSFNPNPTWNPAVDTNTYDGDGQLVKQLEAIGTDHFDSYWVRSTVLGGAVILWTEVQTNSYYAPGWSSTRRLASIYAGGDKIAQSTDGNVAFEHAEPLTGRRSGTFGSVEPDPLGQEVGTYDPGPEEPGDVGDYPEPHEYGNAEDISMGCTLDGITIDCATRARFTNPLSARWSRLFLPRPWRPRIDRGRTPSTFPTSESQIGLNQIFRDVLASSPVGAIFFPTAEDLARFITPTFLSPQNSKVPPGAGWALWRKGSPLSDCVKNLLAGWFSEINLGRVITHNYLPWYVRRDAEAYTEGRHIFFRDGIDQHSIAGIALIAHELTHIRQQIRYLYTYPERYAAAAAREAARGRDPAGRGNPFEREAQDMQTAIANDLYKRFNGRNPCT